MAKAKRLPSGNYRVRVKYKDDLGNVHTESITRPTAAEANMAAEKLRNSIKRYGRNDYTVKEAVERYIEVKRNVLSPSTIKGYKRYLPKYDVIGKIRLINLTSDTLQVFVNSLSEKHSAKYVRNVYALLMSTISLYLPDMRFRVTLPKNYTPKLNVPLEGDIARLVRESDGYMKIAICLAGFCSMRRGEICALKYGDIDREANRIHVHADMVSTDDYKWIYKDMPKTDESNRIIDCPQFVIDLLGDGEPDEYIIKMVPNTITNGFSRLRSKLELNIRFHDLRSFFASSMTVMGVPDIYIAQQGGWKKGSPVMKRHYQKVMDDKKSIYAKKTESYFKKILK